MVDEINVDRDWQRNYREIAIVSADECEVIY